MKKPKLLSEQLREVILAADRSRYRIARETGLTEASLSRFVNHVSGLSMDSIDRIGECLHLELVVRQEPKRAPRGKAIESWRA